MTEGTRRHVKVVAAFIERDGRVLLDRRRAGGAFEGLWEFPGGKLEPGESELEGLRRELREELGVEATVRAPAMATIEHAYEAFDLTLALYAAELHGTPRALEAAEIAWYSVNDLEHIPMPAANRPLLAQARAAPRESHD